MSQTEYKIIECFLNSVVLDEILNALKRKTMKNLKHLEITCAFIKEPLAMAAIIDALKDTRIKSISLRLPHFELESELFSALENNPNIQKMRVVIGNEDVNERSQHDIHASLRQEGTPLHLNRKNNEPAHSKPLENQENIILEKNKTNEFLKLWVGIPHGNRMKDIHSTSAPTKLRALKMA